MPGKLWEKLAGRLANEEIGYSPVGVVVDSYSGALCVVAEAPPPGAFTLSGKVTDATTKNPISGVAITLDSAQATTDQNGNYSFPNIAAKTYRIVFTKQGYTTVTRDISVSQNTTLNTQMTAIVPPPEEKKFPWWMLGVAGGAIVIVAVATTKRKEVKK